MPLHFMPFLWFLVFIPPSNHIISKIQSMVTNNLPNADLYQIGSTIIFGYGLGAYFVIQNFYISDCSTS